MNSRQRRGIILLILSVLCALGAFAGVLSVINDVKSKVGPEVTAYRVKSDIEPYTELGATQFEKVEMPERWLSENAVTDLSRVRGKIAVTTLKAGSLLQTDMIVDTPALRPGQQEVAIMIDAATGVAGKITPGSTVNVYATFEGPREGDPDQSKIIVTGAKVIDVGELTSLEPDEDSRDREPTDASPSPSPCPPSTRSASPTPSRSPGASGSRWWPPAATPRSPTRTGRTNSRRTSESRMATRILPAVGDPDAYGPSRPCSASCRRPNRSPRSPTPRSSSTPSPAWPPNRSTNCPRS